MKTLAWLRYRLWCLFGGHRTESGFRLLAKSIEGNRKLISDLRRLAADLERRVWELEGHTPDETMAMVASKLQEFAKAAQAEGGEASGKS